jgi:hypothetical protein
MLPASNRGKAGAQLLLLEVTLFACRDNATLPSPDCELELLWQLLIELVGAGADRQRWQEMGAPHQQLLSA